MKETDFYLGQELDWLHGSHSHRIATVLKIESDKVYLSGVTKNYWMKKKSLLENINRSFPITSHRFND